MPTTPLDTLGALRHTCDRCRKLKVRCQRDTVSVELAGDNDVPISCIRCSRAGTICEYSPPQRSGRPPVPRYGGHSWSISKPINKKGQQKQPTHHTFSRLSPIISPSTLSSCSSSSSRPFPQGSEEDFQWDDSWDGHGNCGSLMEDFQSFLNVDQCLRNPSSTMDVGLNLQGLKEPTTAAQQVWNPFGQDRDDDIVPADADLLNPDSHERKCESDDTAEDITDLSDLNLRIYKVRARTSMPIPCDELTDVTRCLLRVINRVIGCAKQRVQGGEQFCPPSPFSPLTSEGLRQQSVDHVVDSGETPGILRAADTATIMMILSCYQRLFDSFTQACLVLRAQFRLSDNSEACPEGSSGATQYAREASGLSFSGDESAPSYSIAQVAMVIELICHLLNQLERGLDRLFLPGKAGSGTTSPASSSLSVEPPALVSSLKTAGISSAIQRYWHELNSGSPEASTTKVDTSSACTASSLECSVFVNRTLLRAQQSLHTHIQMVKKAVRASHDV